MGNALRELMADSRAEGKAEGRENGILEERTKIILRFLSNGGSEEDAIRMLEVTKEDIAAARERV